MSKKKRKTLVKQELKTKWSRRQDLNLQPPGPKPGALPNWATSRYGALEGIRTPDLLVRSQTLYPAELRAHDYDQMIVNLLKWWLRMESNHRHEDFQSSALPTELQSHMAVSTGIEPAIFCVTGRRVNPCTTRPHLGCGSRIWTYGLRVMSPTSYRTALSRYILLLLLDTAFISYHVLFVLSRGNFKLHLLLSPLL